MRHFTLPQNTIIEVVEGECDRVTPEDDISASVVTVKVNTTSMQTQTEVPLDVPDVDVIDEEIIMTQLMSRKNSTISGQFLKPPRIANSLVNLRQLAERRSSLMSRRKQKTV